MSATQILDDVRASARQFRRAIFWRDVREVGASAVLAIFFLWIAIVSPGWARMGAAVLAAACVFVGGFLLLDRVNARNRKRLNETPQGYLKGALLDVQHQIWLLRNVFWWYLLPLSIGLTAWVIGSAIEAPVPEWIWLIAFPLVCGPVYYGIYKLNQNAVRKQLLPERERLRALLKDWQAINKG